MLLFLSFLTLVVCLAGWFARPPRADRSAPTPLVLARLFDAPRPAPIAIGWQDEGCSAWRWGPARPAVGLSAVSLVGIFASLDLSETTLVLPPAAPPEAAAGEPAIPHGGWFTAEALVDTRALAVEPAQYLDNPAALSGWGASPAHADWIV